ncbi:MAG: efflux transporter outer membrane subunit [Sphingomonadales bacterium]|nr:efflux transporter outer membrane subunit [Sphingomonadales bacterium]MDE2171054.1 efflux transporter outer membrane subunit [Sphingomonadales bacterium]
MSFRRSVPILTLLASTMLSACTVGPDYHKPEVTLTPAYQTPATLAQADARWWTSFHDPMLDHLVEQALVQNLDIAAAAARIDQARGVARAAGAALLPSVGLAGSAEQDHTSLQTPIGAAARQLGLPRDYALYQLGAQASWEIDLFGGLRRGREAARADLASTLATADAVRLSIAAETADAYLQLRGLQARLAVAQDQLATEQHLVSLVRQQADEGVVADQALNRTLGEQQGIEASLPPLRAAIAGQANRLAVLCGQQAGALTVALMAPSVIPLAPDPSGSAQPAELMRRRPDLVAAERQVAASNARIGAAIAEYYPHVSLGGLLGVATVGGSSLLTGDALQASGAAGLRWRLFDFGKVDAQVAQARGREAEALATYRGAVLGATQDVENALSRLVEGRAEIALRQQQVTSLSRARDQARAAYAAGVISLIDVLDADRALLDASDRLAAARADTARASVAAIRALGGGWQART